MKNFSSIGLNELQEKISKPSKNAEFVPFIQRKKILFLIRQLNRTDAKENEEQ